jgi:hypothetical protein
MSLPFEIVFKDVGHALSFYVVGRLQDGSVTMGTQKRLYIDVTRQLNNNIVVLLLVRGTDKPLLLCGLTFPTCP